MDDELAVLAQILRARRLRVAAAFLVVLPFPGEKHRHVEGTDVAAAGNGQGAAGARLQRLVAERVAVERIDAGFRPGKAFERQARRVRHRHGEIVFRPRSIAGRKHRRRRVGRALHVVALRVPVDDDLQPIGGGQDAPHGGVERQVASHVRAARILVGDGFFRELDPFAAGGTVLVERSEPQHRLFGGGQIERVLEDLDLHGLPAQHPLQAAHAFLELADTTCTNNIVVGLNGDCTAFEHTALPGKKLAGRNAGTACHIGHRHAGLHGLFDQAHFLGCRPAPSALHRGDHFNTRRSRERIRSHGHNHRRMPMPYRLCRLSGQNRVHSM